MPLAVPELLFGETPGRLLVEIAPPEYVAAEIAAEAVASPFPLGGWLASDGIPPSRPRRGVLQRG
jgi:hypothetical protein